MIRIEKIYKTYKKQQVLKGLSLEAEEGNCVGILGENGSGKSTLLSILAGVQKADTVGKEANRFFLDEIDLFHNRKAAEQLIGYIPQGTPLMKELTALDHLKLWYSCTDRSLEKDLVEGVPAMLGVSEYLHTQVGKMSGGMKKRLAIACGVAHNPRILLMDEPSAALDLGAKTKIGNYIQDFKRQGGIVLLATHDTQELPLCDKLYMFRDGLLLPYSYDGNIQHLVRDL